MRGKAEPEERRRALMAVLAESGRDAIEAAWRSCGIDVEFATIRGPESGLVTVRGRVGGGGAPFNLGEASVTRASVRLPSGEVGHSYALGRDLEKARLSALIDAAWLRPRTRAAVENCVLVPLRALLDDAVAAKRAQTAATKVDFFTMVRGED